MRFVLIALLAACSALPALAQDVRKDDKADKKEVTAPITEIAGKNLDHWIKEIESTDPSRREVAMRTVLEFGPNKAYLAVPALIKELKKHTPTKPIDLSVRVSGTIALSTALAGVKEPDTAQVKEAVAILRRFLKDAQAVVKMRALEALPRLGAEARAAIPEVILLVKDIDTWETRRAAIRTLAALAVDPKNLPEPKVLEAIYKQLHNDSSHDVRLAALQAIAMLGQGGELGQKQYMIRELEGAAKDSDPMIQLYSHLALMTVRHAITQEQLAAIAKLLTNKEDMTVRVQAADALTLAGSMLSLSDKTLQAQVAKVIAGARSKNVGPTLLSTLGDPHPEVVVAAINALASLKYLDDNPTVVANLLSHKDARVRGRAAQALAQLGTKAKLVAGMLQEHLTDADPGVVGACMTALVHMELAGDELEPVAKMLKSPDALVRAQAAQALAQAGPRGLKAASGLVDGLDDRDPGVVANCIVALVQLKYAPAVPALTKVAEDLRQSETIRLAARSAISALQKGEKKQ